MIRVLYIIVNTQFEGIHNYPQAKNYLKYPHRHIFHVQIMLEVKRNNREIEFIAFKNWITKKFKKNLKGKSCEMIATQISKTVKNKYPNRKIKISVIEDNENGVLLE